MDELRAENELKKEYLKSYMPMVRAAKRIEEEIEQLRLDKMLPSMSYDDMPHGTEQRDLSDYMAKLDELEQRLIQARYQRIDRYSMIFRDIEKLENENEKAILTYRYLRGYSWENICVKTEYSWSQVHYIHRKALENFESEHIKDSIESHTDK